MSKGKNVSIASAHARVTMDVTNEPDIIAMSQSSSSIPNSKLVNYAFKHGLNTTNLAFEELDSNTTHDGIAIRKIDHNNYSIIHNLLSPLFIKYNQYDLYFFKTWPYNAMDKIWPRYLIKQNRYKIIGSSDLFFMLELSPEKEDSMPKANQKWNDLYSKPKHRNMLNYICNSVITHWRAE